MCHIEFWIHAGIFDEDMCHVSHSESHPRPKTHEPSAYLFFFVFLVMARTVSLCAHCRVIFVKMTRCSPRLKKHASLWMTQKMVKRCNPISWRLGSTCLHMGPWGYISKSRCPAIPPSHLFSTWGISMLRPPTLQVKCLLAQFHNRQWIDLCQHPLIILDVLRHEVQPFDF